MKTVDSYEQYIANLGREYPGVEPVGRAEFERMVRELRASVVAAVWDSPKGHA